MSPTSWGWVGGAALAFLLAIALFALQLDHRLSWEHWWVPYGVAFVAPIGLWAAYGQAGEPWRGFWTALAAWGLLAAVAALGVGAASTTERAGEVLAVMVAGAAGLGLLIAAWTGWDLHRRAGAPGEAPAATAGPGA